jgi:hypothetical protein
MKLPNIKKFIDEKLFVEVPVEAKERIDKVDKLVLNRIADEANDVLANDEKEFDEKVNELIKIRKAYNSYNEETREEDKPKDKISEGAWKFWATVVSATASGAVVIYSTLYADEGNFVNDFTKRVINKRIDGDKF